MIKENIVSSGKGWLSPQFLVVHSTANPGATAANHASLWSRSDYDYQVHYVSDWREALHTVADDRLCWHVGNANNVSIGIEICEGTNAADVRAGLEIAAKACAEILAAHGWGSNKLVTHEWCSRSYGGSDHTDPIPYFDAWGITFEEFCEMVDENLNGNEDEMTPEQERMLEACYNRLTRTDTAGHDVAQGHDMLGRICMLQEDMSDVHNRLTRTDTAGHDNPPGHDLLGRVQIIEKAVREIGEKLDKIAKK